MEDLPPDDFREWQDIMKILAEDIRETKKLTKEIIELTTETREMVIEARRSADAAVQRADAAWELVVIIATATARNQINRPWYRKLLGLDQRCVREVLIQLALARIHSLFYRTSPA